MFPGLEFHVNLEPAIFIRHQRHAKFTVSVSSAFGSIDQKRETFKILPGYHTSLRILPTVIETSPDFEALSLEVRKCKLPHETEEFLLLKTYSQEGCQFECAVKSAVRICRCLPWFYPNNYTDIPMCDMFGAGCVDEILSNNAYFIE